MPSDPFLKDHRVGRRQYEISRGLRQVTVRDQMVRGVTIIDRMVMTGELPKDNGRLLVVGGGVAGVTAALTARKYDIAVTLLEKSRLFSRFIDPISATWCTERHLDPTLYDWPAGNWRIHNWPGSPLPFRSAQVSELLPEWESVVKAAEMASGKSFEIKIGSELTSPVVHDDLTDRIHVDYLGSREEFHAAVYACSLGKENSTINDVYGNPIRSPDFWSDDKLTARSQGLSKPGRVLIIGGGDGALQDYIRCISGKHPRILIELIEDALQRQPIWHEEKSKILASCDFASRTFNMGSEPMPSNATFSAYYRECDINVNRMLEAQFRSSIKRLVGNRSIQNLLYPILDRLVQGRLPIEIKMIVAGQAFTWCLPLNRFLSLILEQYLTDRTGLGPTILRQTMVATDEAIPFDTGATRSGYRIRTKREGKAGSNIEYWDIVLPRIGITQDPPLYTTGKVPRSRQNLPGAST